jgi:hypothetical protein
MNETEYVPDTEEAAKPPTLAETRKRYREIAPVPDPSAADPGEALGRYLTRVGLQRASLGCHSAEDAEAAGVAMAAVLLWHRLLRHTPGEVAARAAQDIAEAWADGEGVSEWLGKYARCFGVDASEVNGIVQLEALLMSAKTADAERAARDMAKAWEAAEKVADSHARVLYAVSVDLSRGDADAARQLLWEQLDGFDEEPADEGETGLAWLERTKAKPEPVQM